MSNTKRPSIESHIEQLNKEKLPQRDLWAGIEYSISVDGNIVNGQRAQQNSSKTTPVFALAASVLVAMLVGYFSFQTGRLESGQDLVMQMSQQHSQHKDALLTSLDGQPATTQNWQQQLDELDQAAIAIKKALENEPNNPALLKMLQKVYQQQIMLIERVHAPAWQQI
jgi:hypothetical protein